MIIIRHVSTGAHCPRCKTGTPTSIHGRCCDCGYQKFPSTVLVRRARPQKPFVVRIKPKLEDLEEIKKIMRQRPRLSRTAARAT